MARVLLPLAWATSSLPSYGCTPYGASIIAFGPGYLMFATVWWYIVWREYYCLWPGLIDLCYHMARCHMARVYCLWPASSLASYGCTPYGAIMIAFGLCYHIFAIVWLYVVRREHYCIWPGLTHLCYHMAARVWRSIVACGLGYLICAIVWL